MARASLSARRAWIEIRYVYPVSVNYKSLSARRAWIEMCTCLRAPYVLPVALRKESVDRNFAHLTIGPGFQGSLSARRAWIEIDWAKAIFRYLGSLSARRAWIEIPRWPLDVLRIWSLSARRAWIEIVSFRGHGIWPRVALRKESVDRNVD